MGNTEFFRQEKARKPALPVFYAQAEEKRHDSKAQSLNPRSTATMCVDF
jgi:hypothetical protein